MSYLVSLGGYVTLLLRCVLRTSDVVLFELSIRVNTDIHGSKTNVQFDHHENMLPYGDERVRVSDWSPAQESRIALVKRRVESQEVICSNKAENPLFWSGHLLKPRRERMSASKLRVTVTRHCACDSSR